MEKRPSAVLRLRLLFAHGFTEDERRLAEETASTRHPGWVVATGQTLWVPDTRAQDPNSPSRDSPRKVEVRSRLWIPVAKDGEVFGAFGFASARPHAFDERDREVLRGDPTSRRFAVFSLRDGVLLAADAVNSPGDFVASRPLVAKAARPDPAMLADASVPMKEIVAASAA